MTRGGYLMIIGFLVGLLCYQHYSNEKMFQRYETFISDQAKIVDSANNHSFAVSDSIKELKVFFEEFVQETKNSAGKEKDTVIINKITKVYPVVISDKELNSFTTGEKEPDNTEPYALEIAH